MNRLLLTEPNADCLQIRYGVFRVLSWIDPKATDICVNTHRTGSLPFQPWLFHRWSAHLHEQSYEQYISGNANNTPPFL